MEISFWGTPQAGRIFLQPVDEHDLSWMDREAEQLKRLSGSSNWCIAAVPAENWNRDLTPWPAGPVFGKEGFGDGAPATLKRILRLISELEKDRPRRYWLAGYSLAGLFALWAAYQTDLFAGIAAVSPSVWYPGWIDYAAARSIRTPRVYLSLGDREERTKNPVMASVGTAIRQQEKILKESGTETILEWNAGNHFADSDLRTAKGMAWLLKKSGETV